MNDNEFIAKVITDSRPAPQPTTSNTAHILLWCGFGAWLVAVVVTAAITFNNNQGPAYTTPSDPRQHRRQRQPLPCRLGQHPPPSS